MVKNLPANAGDISSTPGSGRSPGEGNGNTCQYSCLGNPMDRGAWKAAVYGVTKVRHNLATKPPPRLLCRFKLQPSPLIKSFQRFVYPPIPIRAGKHP